MASHWRLALLCVFGLLYLNYASAKAFKKRSIDDDDSDELSEVDSNELGDGDREARRSPTFPPYPEEDKWWNLDNYYKTTSDYSVFVPSTTPYYRWTEEVEVDTEKPRERFRDKIVPWFKTQWGHTRNFFKKQYDNAANSIG